MEVDPDSGEKQAREDATGEDGATVKRPRFKSTTFVDKVAKGIQEGLAAQLAGKEAEHQQQLRQQAAEMDKLKAHQAEAIQKLEARLEAMSKTMPAAAAAGGGGDFRTTG